MGVKLNRSEKRKEKVRQVIREFWKAQYGEDLDFDSVSPETQAEIERLASKASEEPERRMRRTMHNVTKGLGLTWKADPPTDHPYKARLDGQIFKHEARLAVVELEAKNEKQVRGALMDLLTHPEGTKLLVLGRAAACNPSKSKTHIREVLQSVSPLVGQTRIGVFTEDELKNDPSILGGFLGLS
jgi:hypothetical protein